MNSWSLIGMHGYKIVESIDSTTKFGMNYRECWLLRQTLDSLEIVLFFFVAQCVPTERERYIDAWMEET